jgi:hypothetical protein
MKKEIPLIESLPSQDFFTRKELIEYGFTVLVQWMGEPCVKGCFQTRDKFSIEKICSIASDPNYIAWTTGEGICYQTSLSGKQKAYVMVSPCKFEFYCLQTKCGWMPKIMLNGRSRNMTGGRSVKTVNDCIALYRQLRGHSKYDSYESWKEYQNSLI